MEISLLVKTKSSLAILKVVTRLGRHRKYVLESDLIDNLY